MFILYWLYKANLGHRCRKERFFNVLLNLYKQWAEGHYDMWGDHPNMHKKRIQIPFEKRRDHDRIRKEEKEKEKEAADHREQEAAENQRLQNEDRNNPNQGVWGEEDAARQRSRSPRSQGSRRARSASACGGRSGSSRSEQLCRQRSLPRLPLLRAPQ